MGRVFDATTRKCGCVEGFFDTGLGEELCVRCEGSCGRCVDAGGCEECPVGVGKVVNVTVSPYCTCLYGHYPDPTAGLLIGETSICFPCHYSC